MWRADHTRSKAGWCRSGGRFTFAFALLAMGTASCGLTAPYVFKADEFNRELVTFNKPRQDGEPVSICYNAVGTSDLDVQRLADNECARFGKHAQRFDDNFNRCPLLVPREAVFICVAPS